MVTICGIKEIFEFVGPVVGLGAAVAWIASAWFGPTNFFTTPIQEVDVRMTYQSRWNARAAILAAISALMQISATFMPLCRAFS